MPIERTTKGGKPGFRFGKTGKVFVYTPGNKSSRERARKAAARQGRAIKAT